ncbi:phosphatidylserine decarboxylase-domain-containing protein [Schizophyllum amplum]|uniref:Phosphatidylserine decarboxylase-domain-containing protein n=1 Tax=Schizophyllum amplum TaxID=97359 RepID=A0A550BY03_9AGAR|nr:phosphatidylserine decarboxylase-domain-containing protein [Auriculariopsis ampla]
MPSCLGGLPNPLRSLKYVVRPPRKLLRDEKTGGSDSKHSDEPPVREKDSAAYRATCPGAYQPISTLLKSAPQPMVAGKPVEEIGIPEDAPDSADANAEVKEAADALVQMIDQSAAFNCAPEDGEADSMDVVAVDALFATTENYDAVQLLRLPWLERIAASYHVGNFVIVRETGERVFEYMPLYARIGMHLLFYGAVQKKVLQMEWLQNLLKEQSIKQGITYDSPASAKAIAGFIKTYQIETHELLQQDLSKYTCFNDFFYRQLRSDARPVQNIEDARGICSMADCRLAVYDNLSLATEFWVKGRNFTIPELLNIPSDSAEARAYDGGSVAIFRLAPSDYHRFHSPVDGTVGRTEHINGEYFTVNPQAINQPGLDILTANVRSVLRVREAHTGAAVAFVAVGALLVGSIRWTAGGEEGREIHRGDVLGYFAYGGSTVVALFPRGAVAYDSDLLENSRVPMETLVKVGWSMGRIPEEWKPEPKQLG